MEGLFTTSNKVLKIPLNIHKIIKKKITPIYLQVVLYKTALLSNKKDVLSINRQKIKN